MTRLVARLWSGSDNSTQEAPEQAPVEDPIQVGSGGGADGIDYADRPDSVTSSAPRRSSIKAPDVNPDFIPGVFSTQARAQRSTVQVQAETPLLNFVSGYYESLPKYNSENGYGQTLNNLIESGKPPFGSFGFYAGGLKGAVQKYGSDAVFNRDLEERIATDFLKGAGLESYWSGDITEEALLARLGKTWSIFGKDKDGALEAIRATKNVETSAEPIASLSQNSTQDTVSVPSVEIQEQEFSAVLSSEENSLLLTLIKERCRAVSPDVVDNAQGKTIAEVIQGRGAQGLYRLWPGTIKAIVKDLGLDVNVAFTEDVQDQLAWAMVEEAGFKDVLTGQKSPQKLMSALAQKWSVIPENMNGDGRWGSTGGTLPADVIEAIKAEKSVRLRPGSHAVPPIREEFDAACEEEEENYNRFPGPSMPEGMEPLPVPQGETVVSEEDVCEEAYDNPASPPVPPIEEEICEELIAVEESEGVELVEEAAQKLSDLYPVKLSFSHPVDNVWKKSKYNPHRMHPVFHTVKAHTGDDYSVRRGTPVKAIGPGRVVAMIESKRGYGNRIIIDHGNAPGAGHVYSLYAHMDGFESGMKVGDIVAQGAVIGAAGDTGITTGPNVHLEVAIERPDGRISTVPPSGAMMAQNMFDPETQALLIRRGMVSRTYANERTGIDPAYLPGDQSVHPDMPASGRAYLAHVEEQERLLAEAEACEEFENIEIMAGNLQDGGTIPGGALASKATEPTTPAVLTSTSPKAYEMSWDEESYWENHPARKLLEYAEHFEFDRRTLNCHNVIHGTVYGKVPRGMTLADLKTAKISDYVVNLEAENISDLTINELKQVQSDYIAWQKNKGIPEKKCSAAAGFPQYITGSLGKVEKQLSLTGEEKYTLAMQTKMMMETLNRLGYQDFLNGNIKRDTMLNRIAGIWAGVPKTDGVSAHQGVGDNKAHLTVKEAREYLDKCKEYEINYQLNLCEAEQDDLAMESERDRTFMNVRRLSTEFEKVAPLGTTGFRQVLFGQILPQRPADEDSKAPVGPGTRAPR